MIVFAVALALSVGSVAQAANALLNSSFEDVSQGTVPPPSPLNGWILADRGGTGEFSTVFAHTGLYSAKIVNGNPNSMKQENVALDPLATYQQSAWVYLTDLADPVLGTAILFRCGWKVLPGDLPVYDAGATYYVTETNKWVQVVDTRSFTGYSVCSMWSVRAFSGAVPVYFDDVDLSSAPACPSGGHEQQVCFHRCRCPCLEQASQGLG